MTFDDFFSWSGGFVETNLRERVAAMNCRLEADARLFVSMGFKPEELTIVYAMHPEDSYVTLNDTLGG